MNIKRVESPPQFEVEKIARYQEIYLLKRALYDQIKDFYFFYIYYFYLNTLSSMSIPLKVSESQETIWDFDVNTVPGMLDTTNLGPIPHGEGSLVHDTSPTTSILSRAPSGLLTPTHASGSNSGEGASGNWADRRKFERKKIVRKSWVYFPENGCEYTTIDGKNGWRCARCML